MARIQFLYRDIFHTDLDMNSFNNRIKLQKLIFVLQSEGVERDYYFNWYIRGPYSSRLARVGYNLQDYPRKSDLTYEAPKKELVLLRKIKKARPLMNNSNSAELIASYLFLESDYKDKTAEELNLRKPRFSLQQ